MIRDFPRSIRQLARDFYIIPLYGLVHWYAGQMTTFIALIFFAIGMYEGNVWATKQFKKSTEGAPQSHPTINWPRN